MGCYVTTTYSPPLKILPSKETVDEDDSETRLSDAEKGAAELDKLVREAQRMLEEFNKG